MTEEELNKGLELHKKWLVNKKEGKRLDLSSANLHSADLHSADLRSADLSSANLRYADLRSANLSSADLRSANLHSADLHSADLRSADLSYADLSYADLRSANLRNADLSSANLSSVDLPDGWTLYSINGVGADRRMTTYWVEGNKIWCGCFIGTLEKFEDEINKTHQTGTVYHNEYMAVLAYFRALKIAGRANT